ncbi:MAG TPA: LuxR C-terminal-related transcriptional regulator [Streptosporangiaceae bacterium]|nr:LuxR C-terminal-related transcriptional regulator [Streptosporangiaceae bacterium]
MGDSDARPRGSQPRAEPSHIRPPRRANSTAIVLVTTKLRHPVLRPGTVGRPRLMDLLAPGKLCPVVSVVAPPGFGKTTLLTQWAERGDRAFAWVSVEEPDNDPKVLLSYIAAALNTVTPIGHDVFAALASPGSSVPGTVVPRLAAAFSAMTAPVTLVLDDVHVLHNRECQAALSALADHVPPGSHLVLAGRAQPPVRLARLRAEARLTEIGPTDLVLSTAEAASLLRAAGVALGEYEVAELHRRTEGWPAALYLAALHLREGGLLPRAAVTFGGANRLVSDYLEAELLSRVSPGQRLFLTRTAVLERLSAPLCEAVLEAPGTAAALAELSRSNLLLVPLGGQDGWYRYHHLFRDMLLASLQRVEPELVPVLRRRAARWCVHNGLAEEALEYSIAAGDVPTAAGLMAELAVPARRQGRAVTLQRWFRWLDEHGEIEEYPAVAALGALIFSWSGWPREADRWADAAERRPGPEAAGTGNPAGAWTALLRAFICRHGVARMQADAQEAGRRFAEEGIVTPGAALLLGIAQVLSGGLETGDATLADAVRIGERTGTHEVTAAALSERSLLAAARAHWTRADALADQAHNVLRQAGVTESYVTPLVCAAQARAALRRGDVTETRRELVHAQRARALLTYTVPHVAVQARIELARVHLDLADLPGARTLMREIDDVLRRRPGLGTLTGQARALRMRMPGGQGHVASSASALTAAELRLLPLLATPLSLAEIAAELAISHNTVKSQTASLYRKLMVTSREQAVVRSRELSLLDG